jgi:septal ring factor EnvC (AmiA/AmiB activator)
MSLLGKIFTVCILLASFFLMIVAMFVYATHKNWSTAYAALNTRLATATSTNAALESKYQNQISQLTAEHEASQQEVRKLESELANVMQQNATTQREVDELRAQRRAAEGIVAATLEANNAVTTEVVGLRGALAENQQARDEAFAKTLDATTQLHVAAGELQSLRERSAQLVQQLAHYVSALRDNGIDPDADVVVQARGKVIGSRRADGGQLIEISLGYDDGVRQGQTVEVFRGERYLGRAQILRADPDRSVGRVLREFQQGTIQEQDDVATKLRVG